MNCHSECREDSGAHGSSGAGVVGGGSTMNFSIVSLGISGRYRSTYPD